MKDKLLRNSIKKALGKRPFQYRMAKWVYAIVPPIFSESKKFRDLVQNKVGPPKERKFYDYR